MNFRFLKRKPFLVIAILPIICAALFVYARTRSSQGAFSLAAGFPRGALVYAQFKDLPELIKLWDQSRLKQQYLESANYHEFQHRHLALKLIERWEEFNEALGFHLDTATIGGAAHNGAAVAIYDIGRLDLVFMAPISEEKLAATAFFQGKEQFESTETPDGTTYYRHEVQADRGRQKQTLAFAAVKGHLVLATNEQLLLRAIANLNGKSRKDRLPDDPAFKILSAAVTPHLITVWVDQARLNDDYYFKHYWLLHNAAELKTIRAGMFDLDLQDEKWVELRDFLTVTDKTLRESARLAAAEIARMRAQIPGDAPFVRIQSIGAKPDAATSLIHETLLDERSGQQPGRGSSWSWESYGDSEFYTGCSEVDFDRYRYIGSEYDSIINDPHDARIGRNQEPGENPLREQLDRQFMARLQQALEPAGPFASISATVPHTITGPLFVEFRRVAVLTLKTPTNLNREILEEAISDAAQSRLTVAGPGVNLKWVSHEANSLSWRELELPMLGWHFCYALRNQDLILSNSPELIAEVLGSSGQPPTPSNSSSAALDNLTIIRLDQRKQAFDDIVGKLDAESIKTRQLARSKKPEETEPAEFFSGNLSSLLDVSSAVRQVEIRRSSSANRLHEEIDFIMK